MKKIIAICLSVLYLSFVTGALLAAGPATITAGQQAESSNEKNEPEASKGVEIFHILHSSKSAARIKVQPAAYSSPALREVATAAPLIHRSSVSHHLFLHSSAPIFLKNRVFRL